MEIIYGNKVRLIDIYKASNIDKQEFGKEYKMGILKGLIWAIKSKKGYIILKDNKKTIGYASIVSLSDEGIKLLETGNIVDVKLPIKHIKRIDKKGLHNFYLSSLAILDEYQNKKGCVLLVNHLFLSLIDFAKKGIFGKRILIDAISDNGTQLSEIFNCDFISNTNHNSKLFDLNIFNLKRNTKEIKELKELYQKEFNNNL